MANKMNRYFLIVLLLSMITKSGFSQINLTLQIHQPSELLLDAGNDTTIKTGENLTLGGYPTASGGIENYNYTWQPNIFLDNPYGSNPNALNILQPVTYILIVEDKNCKKQDTVAIQLSDFTNLSLTINNLNINIYPIPADKNVYIDFDYLDSNKYWIEILDLRGNILHNFSINDKSNILNIESLAPGYYILKIRSQQISKSVTIIKN